VRHDEKTQTVRVRSPRLQSYSLVGLASNGGPHPGGAMVLRGVEESVSGFAARRSNSRAIRRRNGASGLPK
jgi:hypothetical protein